MTGSSVEPGYHGLKNDSVHKDWVEEKADYHTKDDKDGRGEVLVIDGHPVMEQWEKPYMEELARVATSQGGKVLEVGFGLGLSASAIQRCENVTEHIIIEANAGVIERGKKWSENQPHKVTFKHGLWQDVVESLDDESLDGVLYDTYPLNKSEQHTHQFDFLTKIMPKIKKGGVLTYCNLTSIGVLKGQHEEWDNLWKETQVPHIEKCGYKNMSYTTFSITAPSTCDYYSGHTEALVPKLHP